MEDCSPAGGRQETSARGTPDLFVADVSEDYELAMRLQMAGYCVRWATYSNSSSSARVSRSTPLTRRPDGRSTLSVLARSSQFLRSLVQRFHDFALLALLWSRNVRTAGKLSIAFVPLFVLRLGVSLPLTVLMTVMQGLFWPTLDPSFKPIFDTWISVIVIFNVAGPSV